MNEIKKMAITIGATFAGTVVLLVAAYFLVFRVDGERLEAAIDQISANSARVETAISGLGARITDIEEQSGVLAGAVLNIGSEISGVRSQLQGLEQQYSVSAEQLRDVGESIQGISSAYEQLVGRFESLVESVSGITTGVDNLDAINRDFDRLLERPESSE